MAYLTHDIPPLKSVYTQFKRWKAGGTFMRLEDYLREELRVKLG